MSLPQLSRLADRLVEAPAEWPVWSLDFARGAPQRQEFITRDEAWLTLAGGGGVSLNRVTNAATYLQPSPPEDERLLHPMLGCIGAVAAYWAGDPCLHAAALNAGRGTWGLLAARTGGKSSTVAAAARAGAVVVTDDIMVVRGGQACAGPRCVDLRSETAAMLGAGQDVSVPGERERLRLHPGPVAAESELKGLVTLEWGEEVRLERIAPSQRLGLLMSNQTVHLAPQDPAALLDVAALPMWRLVRPRRLVELDHSVDRILQLMAA